MPQSEVSRNGYQEMANNRKHAGIGFYEWEFYHHRLRGFINDGQPWLCVLDVLKATGYRRYTNSVNSFLARLRIPPVDQKFVSLDTPNWPWGTICLSKRGLSLFLKSGNWRAATSLRYWAEDLPEYKLVNTVRAFQWASFDIRLAFDEKGKQWFVLEDCLQATKIKLSGDALGVGYFGVFDCPIDADGDPTKNIYKATGHQSFVSPRALRVILAPRKKHPEIRDDFVAWYLDTFLLYLDKSIWDPGPALVPVKPEPHHSSDSPHL